MEAPSQLPTSFAPECQRFRRARMVTLWSGIGLLSAKLFAELGEPMIGALVDCSGQTSIIIAVVALFFALSAARRAAVKRGYSLP